MKDIITIKQLEKGEKGIECGIYKYTKVSVSQKNIKPIADGIYSAEEYLESAPRVM